MVLEQTINTIKKIFGKTKEATKNTDKDIYINLSQDPDLVEKLTTNEKKVIASFSGLNIFNKKQLQLLHEWFSDNKKIDRTTSISRLKNIRKQLEGITERNWYWDYFSELKPTSKYRIRIGSYTKRMENLEEKLIRNQKSSIKEKELLAAEVNMFWRVKNKNEFDGICEKIENIKKDITRLWELKIAQNKLDKQQKHIGVLKSIFDEIIKKPCGYRDTALKEKIDLTRFLKSFTLENYDLNRAESYYTCSSEELHKKISTYHRTNKRRSLSKQYWYMFRDENSVYDALDRKILKEPLTASTDQEYMNIGMKWSPSINMDVYEESDFHQDAALVKCCWFSELITWVSSSTTPLWLHRQGVSYISWKSINWFRWWKDYNQLELDDINLDSKKNRSLNKGWPGVVYWHQDISSRWYIRKDNTYEDIFGAVSSATLFNKNGWASDRDIIALANTMNNKYGNIYFSMPVLNEKKKLDTVLYKQESNKDKNEVKYIATDIHEWSKVYISYWEFIETWVLSQSSVIRGFKKESDFTHFLKMLKSKNIEFWGFLVREKKWTYKHTIMSYNQLMNHHVTHTNGYSLLSDYLKTSDPSLSISDFDNQEVKKAGIKNRKFIGEIKQKLKNRWKTYLKNEQKFIRERNNIK